MRTVHVAAGIICREGTDEVLAAQRGYGSMRGLWEFPGGKVEKDETAADACRRELAEELQVKVTNVRSFYTVEYDYDDFHLSMECFFCHLAEGEGEPQRSDRQLDLRWVHRRTLADLAWMPADDGLIRELSALDAAAPAEVSPLDPPETVTDADGDGTEDTADDTAPVKKPAKPKAKRRVRKSRKRAVKLIDQIDTDGLSDQEAELVRRREAIKRSMKGNKRADTKPEMLVRQRLREAGLPGYRLQWNKVPGRPDIAYPGRRVAIFVNGCFWHRCPHCHPSVPKRNVAFWEAKFARNVERDRRAVEELEQMGWTVITIWECQLKKDVIDATMADVIEQVRAVGR